MVGVSAPSPVPRPIRIVRVVPLYLIFGAALAACVDPPRHSGNVWSRYMTIESIVERGTLVVEDSPLLEISGTPDLVQFDGRLYSDKPPVLSALGALVYWPLNRSGIAMAGSLDGFRQANFALVLSLVILPSALAVAALRLLLQAVDIHRGLADVLALGFGFSSLLFTYGVTFTNHSAAAGLLTTAFALLVLQSMAGRLGRWSTGLIGLLAALAATMDIPTGGTLWLGFLIWFVWKARSRTLAFLIGSAPPVLAHSVLQSLVTGSPLPAEMYPEAFEYEGSYWLSEAGRFEETVPRWRFLIELLFGPQGWFTVTPVLLLAPLGWFAALRRRRDAVRDGAVVIAASTLVLLLYYSFGVRRTDFAGQSFGTRHLLAISPLVFFYAVVALEWLRARFWRVCVFGLMLIGAVYAFEGMKKPWIRIERRVDVFPAEELPLWVLQKLVLYPHSSYER